MFSNETQQRCVGGGASLWSRVHPHTLRPLSPSAMQTHALPTHCVFLQRAAKPGASYKAVKSLYFAVCVSWFLRFVVKTLILWYSVSGEDPILIKYFRIKNVVRLCPWRDCCYMYETFTSPVTECRRVFGVGGQILVESGNFINPAEMTALHTLVYTTFCTLWTLQHQPFPSKEQGFNSKTYKVIIVVIPSYRTGATVLL